MRRWQTSSQRYKNKLKTKSKLDGFRCLLAAPAACETDRLCSRENFAVKLAACWTRLVRYLVLLCGVGRLRARERFVQLSVLGLTRGIYVQGIWDCFGQRSCGLTEL